MKIKCQKFFLFSVSFKQDTPREGPKQSVSSQAYGIRTRDNRETVYRDNHFTNARLVQATLVSSTCTCHPSVFSSRIYYNRIKIHLHMALPEGNAPSSIG